jgi:hypothetical protein
VETINYFIKNMVNTGKNKAGIESDILLDRSILDEPVDFFSNRALRSKVDNGQALDEEAITESLTRTMVSPVAAMSDFSVDVDLSDLENHDRKTPISDRPSVNPEALSQLVNSGKIGMVDQPEANGINSKRFQRDSGLEYDSQELSNRDEVKFFRNRGQSVVLEYLDNLAIYEEERLNIKDLEKTRIERGSRLKNIGNSLLSAGRSLVTALPRLVDALLPNSWQVTPKIEMLDGLKRSKKEELSSARKQYERDLQIIGAGYDTISDYVKYYREGRELPTLDINGAEALNNFVCECKFDQNSPHYSSIRHSIIRKMNERTQKFNHTIADIQHDKSAEEMAEEILKNSWALRAREKVHGWFSSKQGGEKPEFHSRELLSPAKGLYVTYASDHQARIREQGQVPATEEVTIVGRKVMPFALRDTMLDLENHVTENISVRTTTDIPDTHKTTIGPKKRRGGFLRWAVAGAAAIATVVGLGGTDNSRQADGPNGQKITDASALTEKDITSAVNQPLEKGPKASPTTLPVELQNPIASKRQASIKAQMDATKGFREHKSVNKVAQTAPKSAKTVNIPARVKQPIATSVQNLPKTQELPKTEVSADTRTLSEGEKITQLNLVEAKVSAYKRRLSDVEKSVGLLNSYRSVLSDVAKTQQIPGMLKNISGLLTNLNTTGDIKKVDAVIAQVDHIMADAEKITKAVNEGATIVPQGQAMNLLKVTQQLAGSADARFSINYSQNTTNGRKAAVYNVNLREINQKLAAIKGRLDNWQSVSMNQQMYDRLDAEYWVGYLQFVNWHLEHNRTQVSVK